MFHAIKPLNQLSLTELRDFAYAAADRDDADANPFPIGTEKHSQYQRFFDERSAQLCTA